LLIRGLGERGWGQGGDEGFHFRWVGCVVSCGSARREVGGAVDGVDEMG
jgi:hypothetical protein